MTTMLQVKPLRDLPRSERKLLRGRMPLHYAVRCSGAPQYTDASVDAYKDRRLREFHYPEPIKVRERIAIKWVMDIGYIMVCMSGFYLTLIEHQSGLAWITLFVGVASMYFGIKGKVVVKIVQPARQPFTEWRVETLEDYRLGYDHNVPEEVESLVAEIQMRCPGAEAEVHYLDRDPFIRMVYKHPISSHTERIYVAVWDEDGFIPAPVA